MDRRAATEAIAGNLVSRFAAAGESPATLAEATDIDLSAAHAILDGSQEISITDLVTVGGFLRTDPAVLLAELAA